MGIQSYSNPELHDESVFEGEGRLSHDEPKSSLNRLIRTGDVVFGDTSVRLVPMYTFP